MKFDKYQDLSWNTLVVYINLQCILTGSKPQNNFFVLHFVLCTLNNRLLNMKMNVSYS